MRIFQVVSSYLGWQDAPRLFLPSDPRGVGGRHPPGRCRRRCLVANRAPLPQKWPPHPWNVADSCQRTSPTKPTERSRARYFCTHPGTPTAPTTLHSQPLTASVRRGNNYNSFKDFHLKAKAGIWPWLSNMCHIRLTAISSGTAGS